MTQDIQVPIVDLGEYLALRDGGVSDNKVLKDLCQQVSLALSEFGALIVKDPRVTEDHNNQFLTLMEQYFEQPYDEKIKDARPHLHYQVGITPEGVEVPKCGADEKCLQYVQQLLDEDKPVPATGPDAKWRFFWRIGERPVDTEFPELNAESVIPQPFPQWSSTLNQWGQLMLNAVHDVSEMAALGFGLKRDAFTSLTEQGPHLLAPTGSDLQKYNTLGDVLAGFHYDLNFLTIHGKSRFPGLEIWNKQGKKIKVKVPDGCLLVQAGKQLELLTGGVVTAGYHQVTVMPETVDAISKAQRDNRSLWRISSTLFYHVQSDKELYDLLTGNRKDVIKAGSQVQKEIENIKLKI
ncbi:hypothetical protein MIR68_002946 [Amoeboaphelidium protococcarum]|nr:hypothetical protein MIR68_002946 [Amoeboaphelidium protococcarum]